MVRKGADSSRAVSWRGLLAQFRTGMPGQPVVPQESNAEAGLVISSTSGQ